MHIEAAHGRFVLVFDVTDIPVQGVFRPGKSALAGKGFPVEHRSGRQPPETGVGGGTGAGESAIMLAQAGHVQDGGVVPPRVYEFDILALVVYPQQEPGRQGMTPHFQTRRQAAVQVGGDVSGTRIHAAVLVKGAEIQGPAHKPSAHPVHIGAVEAVLLFLEVSAHGVGRVVGIQEFPVGGGVHEHAPLDAAPIAGAAAHGRVPVQAVAGIGLDEEFSQSPPLLRQEGLVFGFEEVSGIHLREGRRRVIQQRLGLPAQGIQAGGGTGAHAQAVLRPAR